MAQQQERKDRDQTTPMESSTERGMQSNRARNALASRDPFAAFWRDPFGSFWNDPFSLLQRETRRTATGAAALWTPQIETFQRGDQFVVRADLPGMRKEDIDIELTDDSLTIEGERREEHEEDREGYYRSERSYGSFYRVVPLPEGAIAETAKAGFDNGVLEVTIQAPPREVSRKRRLEISGASEGRTEKERKAEGQR
ncbi:MAG: Hsp20/alpha crystallin family protein [Acidobacteria bacterium]|nr:MAG: Hsp20/alpha crystallin family protein [Acidobacteriota bacterium]